MHLECEKDALACIQESFRARSVIYSCKTIADKARLIYRPLFPPGLMYRPEVCTEVYLDGAVVFDYRFAPLDVSGGDLRSYSAAGKFPDDSYT